MKTISRYIMTLALLLTAVTGAWATDPNTVYWTNETWAGWAENVTTHTVGDITITATGSGKVYESTDSGEPLALQAGNNDAITFTSNGKPFSSIAIQVGYGNTDIAGWTYNSSTWSYEWSGTPSTSVTLSGCDIKADMITFTFAEPAIEVIPVAEPAANTKQWTFTQPGSDVVLTPIYSAATIYDADGQTEKMAYETLKEAFANVQDGDVIKLDWNVTLTENLETPTIDGGVEFTLDFNGYTLDCGTKLIKLNNAGDELTLKDTSGKDKLGGLKCIGTNAVKNAKYIFDSGRYKFGEYSTAEDMNALFAATDGYELADGKEFIDLEGGPDADDFNLTVGYATFELTIGKGRFATFYAAQNVTLADAEQAAAGVGLYTIKSEGIDLDNNKVYVTKVNDPAIAGMPLLVYNGSEADMIVKLTVTPDDATAVDVAPEFKGTAEAREFTATEMTEADYYVLSGGKAFAPVRGTGTIAAHKCWLEFAKQEIPSARQLTIVFDNGEATGINEVIEVNEVSDDSWYDLNGRKINAKPTRKGVYVKDGKKVVR